MLTALSRLALLAAALLAAPLRAEPRLVPLDGDWAFRADSAAPASLYAADTPLAGWSRIAVPGNWFLQGHDYNGAAWYARDLGLAALPAGAQAWLEFDGADY